MKSEKMNLFSKSILQLYVCYYVTTNKNLARGGFWGHSLLFNHK